jgi:iron complex outermembrane receptor protein
VGVVTRQAIDDQGVRDVTGALTSVSGVRADGPLRFDGLLGRTVRGFQAEQYQDGMPLMYQAGDRDSLAGVERIEVVKGPSAGLFATGAGGSVGGAVDVVTARPEAGNRVSAGLSVGSESYVSPRLSANADPFGDGSLRLRVDADAVRSDSYIDTIEIERWTVQPAVAWVGEDTAITLQARFSRREQQDYLGLPLAGTIAPGPTIDRETFVGEDGVPDAMSKTAMATATIEHRLSSEWSLRLPVRYSDSVLDEPVQFTFLSFAPLPAGTFAVWNGYLRQDITQLTAAPSVVGTFGETSVGFTLDYDRVTDEGFLDAAPAGPVDLTADARLPYAKPVPGPFTRFLDNENTYTTYGATFQVQTVFQQVIHLAASLRAATLRIDNQDLTGAAPDYDDSHTRLLPKAGVAIDLGARTTWFAGFGRGMRGLSYMGIDEPQPEFSTQIETGFRWRDDGFAASLAGFHITRENVLRTVGLVQEQTGEMASQGIEADLAWRMTPSWSVLANYALTDTEVTEGDATSDGATFIGIPRHAGRLWGRYQVVDGPLRGTFAGAGLTSQSEQEATIPATVQAPGYTTFDATVGWERGRWRAAVTGTNLTGKEYWDVYEILGGPNVIPGAPLTVIGSLDVTF